MNVAGKAWHYSAGTALRRDICWWSSVMRCTGSTGSAVGVGISPGILRGSPYMSSDSDDRRSSLNAVRITRTRESTSVHCCSVWHKMAAFSVLWNHSTSVLAAGWCGVVRET
jgi:hypothetical protein